MISFSASFSVSVAGTARLSFGNADGSPVTVEQIAGLEVYARSELAGESWTLLPDAVSIENGRAVIDDPVADGIRSYKMT